MFTTFIASMNWLLQLTTLTSFDVVYLERSACVLVQLDYNQTYEISVIAVT